MLSSKPRRRKKSTKTRRNSTKELNQSAERQDVDTVESLFNRCKSDHEAAKFLEEFSHFELWLAFYEHWDLLANYLEKKGKIDLNATIKPGENNSQGITTLWLILNKGRTKLAERALAVWDDIINLDASPFSPQHFEHGVTVGYLLNIFLLTKELETCLSKINYAINLDTYPSMVGHHSRGISLAWSIANESNWELLEKCAAQVNYKINLNASPSSRANDDHGITIAWFLAFNNHRELLEKFFKASNYNVYLDAKPVNKYNQEREITVGWLLAFFEHWDLLKACLITCNYNIDLKAKSQCDHERWKSGITLVYLLITNNKWDILIAYARNSSQRISLSTRLNEFNGSTFKQVLEDNNQIELIQIFTEAERPTPTPTSIPYLHDTSVNIMHRTLITAKEKLAELKKEWDKILLGNEFMSAANNKAKLNQSSDDKNIRKFSNSVIQYKEKYDASLAKLNEKQFQEIENELNNLIASLSKQTHDDASNIYLKLLETNQKRIALLKENIIEIKHYSDCFHEKLRRLEIGLTHANKKAKPVSHNHSRPHKTAITGNKLHHSPSKDKLTQSPSVTPKKRGSVSSKLPQTNSTSNDKAELTLTSNNIGQQQNSTFSILTQLPAEVSETSINEGDFRRGGEILSKRRKINSRQLTGNNKKEKKEKKEKEKEKDDEDIGKKLKRGSRNPPKPLEKYAGNARFFPTKIRTQNSLERAKNHLQKLSDLTPILYRIVPENDTEHLNAKFLLKLQLLYHVKQFIVAMYDLTTSHSNITQLRHLICHLADHVTLESILSFIDILQIEYNKLEKEEPEMNITYYIRLTENIIENNKELKEQLLAAENLAQHERLLPNDFQRIFNFETLLCYTSALSKLYNDLIKPIVLKRLESGSCFSYELHQAISKLKISSHESDLYEIVLMLIDIIGSYYWQFNKLVCADGDADEVKQIYGQFLKVRNKLSHDPASIEPAEVCTILQKLDEFIINLQSIQSKYLEDNKSVPSICFGNISM